MKARSFDGRAPYVTTLNTTAPRKAFGVGSVPCGPERRKDQRVGMSSVMGNPEQHNQQGILFVPPCPPHGHLMLPLLYSEMAQWGSDRVSTPSMAGLHIQSADVGEGKGCLRTPPLRAAEPSVPSHYFDLIKRPPLTPSACSQISKTRNCSSKFGNLYEWGELSLFTCY